MFKKYVKKAFITFIFDLKYNRTFFSKLKYLESNHGNLLIK